MRPRLSPRGLLGLVLATLAGLLLGCGGGDEESASPAAVESADGSFTLELPDNWSVASADEVDEIFGNANPQIDEALGEGASAAIEGNDIYFRDGDAEARTNVNVVSETLPEGTSFEDAVQAGVGLIEGSLPDGQIDSGPDPTTLDGEDAFQIRYSATVGAGEAQFVLIQASHEGEAYSITLTTSTDDAAAAGAEFEGIIDSWRWS